MGGLCIIPWTRIEMSAIFPLQPEKQDAVLRVQADPEDVDLIFSKISSPDGFRAIRETNNNYFLDYADNPPLPWF